MRLKAYILFSCFLLLSSASFSQQPSHYIIGKEELAETDVYSLFQDHNADIWISSNRGVMKYDGYSFQEYQSAHYKNRSLFGLKADNDGKVFCFNLGGQIFHIQNDSLQLYYEIPDSLLSTVLDFNFDNQNRLVVLCKKVLLVDNDLKTSILVDENISSWRLPKTENGELVFLYNREKKLGHYKNSKITYTPFVDSVYNIGERHNNFKAYLCNNSNFIIDNYGLMMYHINDSTIRKLPLRDSGEKIVFGEISFITNTKQIWLSSKNKGCNVFNTDGTKIYQQEKIFKDYFISSFMEDREGNLWIGTFGKGIIVIPNKDIYEYSNATNFSSDIINAIVCDDKGNIFFGGQNGHLHQLSQDDTFKTLREEAYPYEYIFYIPQSNSLLINSPKNIIFDLDTKEDEILTIPVIKDFKALSEFEYIFSSSGGVHIVSTNPNEREFYNHFSNYDKAIIEENNSITFELGRCTSVAMDVKNKIIWAGSYQGLMRISENGIEEVSNDNNAIAAVDLIWDNDTLWIATIDNGILTFHNGNLKHSLSSDNYLFSNNISKLEKRDNMLYIAQSGAFQRINLENKEVHFFQKPDGLNANTIRDFTISENHLWLATGVGIQRFRFEDLQKNTTAPLIEFNKFKVNDNEIAMMTDTVFSHTQNRMEFQFVAKAFRHRGQLKYHYRLEGLNNESWQIGNYLNTSVKYSSLPSGEYTFVVKATNENMVESKTLRFSFTINKPYWLTWWFYLICALMLGAVILVFFLIRISVIKERLELEKQLKASEVTAIKAQMNPHFVFNALNSVQDLIMQKDIRSSTLYLAKFADLMRKTLDVSEKEFILLSEEVDMLGLYLELEKLRFVEDFHYTINMDMNQEQRDSIMIHSMLLQPYVENAIKHGLLHKIGMKELDINFFIENQKLVCEIIDNGVGRKMSTSINKRRAKYHRSFASQANRKRIDLINESSNHKIKLDIEDMFEENKATGTKVKLVLPLIMDN